MAGGVSCLRRALLLLSSGQYQCPEPGAACVRPLPWDGPPCLHAEVPLHEGFSFFVCPVAFRRRRFVVLSSEAMNLFDPLGLKRLSVSSLATKDGYFTGKKVQERWKWSQAEGPLKAGGGPPGSSALSPRVMSTALRVLLWAPFRPGLLPTSVDN